jgi:hypothetical protein
MWPHDKYFQELDEHNAPTEPLNTIHPPSNPAGIPAGEPIYPVLPPLPTSARNKKKPSSIPTFVGISFVAVQLLLLVRFALKLIGLQGNVPWVSLVYAVSNIFVLPFRLILHNLPLPLPIPTSIELYTLLAILFYGLLSRILVRVLKAILH